MTEKTFRNFWKELNDASLRHSAGLIVDIMVRAKKSVLEFESVDYITNRSKVKPVEGLSLLDYHCLENGRFNDEYRNPSGDMPWSPREIIQKDILMKGMNKTKRNEMSDKIPTWDQLNALVTENIKKALR